jgi:N-succinyl-L-ornithine transcarbamylase
MKNFVSVKDVVSIDALVQKAMAYKAMPYKDKQLGVGKRVGLLFMNPSMRTRLSTQIAAQNLGMEAIVFNMDKDGWKLELEDGAVMNGTTVEHIKDAAPVLGAYFDLLCIRTFPTLVNKQDDYDEVFVNLLIQYSGIPVISLESATLHPLQSLADVISIKETFKEERKPKVVLTWAPHIKPIPQCVANSFAQWMNAWNDADLVITHPEGYELDGQFTKGAVIEHDQKTALENADFVYVKNWSSYTDYGRVLAENKDWMLTTDHLQHTNNARVMHCLPVRRNVELSDEVLDSKNSIVNLQAANRVWAAQAVLAEILTTQIN